jgi:murein L,D-transpeptidase YafK
MWNSKFKFAVSLQLKQLQFRLKTWRQGREIARAYGAKRALSIRTIGVVAVCCAIIAVGTPGIAHLVVHRGQLAAAAGRLWRGIHLGSLVPRIPHKDLGEGPKSPSLEKPAKGLKNTPVRNTEPLGADSGKKALTAASALRETTAVSGGMPAASPASSQAPVWDTAGVGEVEKENGKIGATSLIMTYCILANKADRTLYLLRRSEGGETWKSIEQFPILVGRNDGQKVAAGDERTPEGMYFIVGRREAEELNAIYGPLAYMLNYPNEDDRKAGRTGQGIWIHGTREDTTREATRGCVVLDNDNLLALAHYLQLGIGTPVVILNSSGLGAPEQALNFRLLKALRERILFEYNARRAEFTGLLSQWKHAWESRDIENYSKFYDPDRFFGEGMRWDAWREKKQRTFQAYSSIAIGLDKISVSEFSESTAVILFMQRYESNVLRVQRPKKLSFFKKEGGWRIFKEETFSRQELVL